MPNTHVIYPSFTSSTTKLLHADVHSGKFALCLRPGTLCGSMRTTTIIPRRFRIPFNGTHVHHRKASLAVVACNGAARFYLSITRHLTQRKIKDIRIVSLHSLVPLSGRTVFTSMQGANGIVIIRRSGIFSKFNTRVTTRVTKRVFHCLSTPMRHINSAFAPMNFGPVLRQTVLPGSRGVCGTTGRLLRFWLGGQSVVGGVKVFCTTGTSGAS